MNESLIPELPGFDDPLGLLRACHARMLGYCDMLEKLPAHIAAGGIDDEARSAIRSLVSYFSTSAVQHHQDEEQDLFPILIHQSLKLAEIIYRLKQEHEQLDHLWQALATDLDKPSTLVDNPEFAAHAQAYAAACRRHIDAENKELLSMAQHILSHRQLEDIGRAMAKRRGQRY